MTKKELIGQIQDLAEKYLGAYLSPSKLKKLDNDRLIKVINLFPDYALSIENTKHYYKELDNDESSLSRKNREHNFAVASKLEALRWAEIVDKAHSTFVNVEQWKYNYRNS